VISFPLGDWTKYPESTGKPKSQWTNGQLAYPNKNAFRICHGRPYKCLEKILHAAAITILGGFSNDDGGGGDDKL